VGGALKATDKFLKACNLYGICPNLNVMSCYGANSYMRHTFYTAMVLYEATIGMKAKTEGECLSLDLSFLP
jgi:hypothetical protein